jgi:hypothetical protein
MNIWDPPTGVMREPETQVLIVKTTIFHCLLISVFCIKLKLNNYEILL